MENNNKQKESEESKMEEIEKKETKSSNFPEVGELVLCTVGDVLKTSAFVKLDKYNQTGILVMSEISPGRIRNIRDFVVPNKKIVCKVLRVDKEKGHIDLSLRRVSLKETKEAIVAYKREKEAEAILKRAGLAKESIDKLNEKIKQGNNSLFEFLQNATENPELFKKFGLTKESEIIIKLIKERVKIKKIIAKSKFSVKFSLEREKSVDAIKKALDVKKPNVKITYLGSPFYHISVESNNYKEANKILLEVLEEIKKRIKQFGGEVITSVKNL